MVYLLLLKVFPLREDDTSRFVKDSVTLILFLSYDLSIFLTNLRLYKTKRNDELVKGGDDRP